MKPFRAAYLVLLGLVMCVPASAVAVWQGGSRYDPEDVGGASHAAPTLELVVRDADRHREIPIRVLLPGDFAGAAPVILFSHGLGGSREGNTWLGVHWAARGYAVVFLQHPGSDSAVWEGVGAVRRMAALRHAASVENFLLRVRDVSVVLDQLERWNVAGSGHPLAGRLDLSHVGMSGHSFGAVTTQAVSGEVFDAPYGESGGFRDARIRSAFMMSPSPPRRGSPAQAFGAVSIPWLLMTGTHDESPIGNVTAQSRREVFAALPAGQKYELVLDGAEHSAFSDRALPGDSLPRNPNHHRAVLAISTAFWDSTLKGSADALAWLAGEGPAKVLESTDRWRAK